MARKLDDIFNECYERIRSGESLESCLNRHPEHAVELEPLLRTALDIGRRASYIQPRPEFKHWSLVRLEGEQHYISQQRQPAKPGLSSLRRSWAVAVAAVLILLLAGSGTVIASSNAMPDDPLYTVKLATEEVKLTFAVTDAQKAQVHIQLAETRAAEVETMANEGKTDQAAITAERFAEELEQASLAMAKMESAMSTAPPSTTTTEPTLTEPPPPTPEEVPPAPPATVTEEQPTPEEVPPAPPATVTEEQPTPEEVPPAPPATVTEEQPTPSKDTKLDKWATQRERFKKSVEESASKSLTALEKAKEKASPQTKKDWQRAIDKIWEKGREREPDKNGTWEWRRNGNGGESNTVNPTPSQPYPSR